MLKAIIAAINRIGETKTHKTLGELILTQFRAETAAAYERAARICEDRNDEIWDSDTGDKVGLDGAAEKIRALATLGQTSALAAIEAAAEARGMRMAAKIADNWATDEQRRFGNGGPANAILAAIPQGDTTND